MKSLPVSVCLDILNCTDFNSVFSNWWKMKLVVQEEGLCVEHSYCSRGNTRILKTSMRIWAGSLIRHTKWRMCLKCVYIQDIGTSILNISYKYNIYVTTMSNYKNACNAYAKELSILIILDICYILL